MKKQAIIDKVIKLLDLANSTTFSEEAETARNMAAELMAKHDMAEIEAEEKPQFDTIEHTLTRKAAIKYDAVLINIISRFNGVAYIKQTGGGRAKNIFVGHKTDLEGNDYMMDILFQQRLTSWKKYLAQHKKDYGFSPSGSDKQAWMMGFAFGLKEKFDDLVAMKEEKIQEHGLVPVDKAVQALDDYKKGNDVKSSKGRPITVDQDGKEAGRNAHIHKGLSGQTTVGLIG